MVRWAAENAWELRIRPASPPEKSEGCCRFHHRDHGSFGRCNHRRCVPRVDRANQKGHPQRQLRRVQLGELWQRDPQGPRKLGLELARLAPLQLPRRLRPARAGVRACSPAWRRPTNPHNDDMVRGAGFLLLHLQCRLLGKLADDIAPAPRASANKPAIRWFFISPRRNWYI